MQSFVAILLYPGCVFFEVALAAEVVAKAYAVRCYTPDGAAHSASNGTSIATDGDFAALAESFAVAVLIPGGDPGSLLEPKNLAQPALEAQARAGALLAGICAGNLVLAASGLLAGRRGTHNYTAEHAPPEKVAATKKFWQGMRFERSDLVRDGSVITAQPWAYRKYAAEVGLALGILQPSQAQHLVSYATRGRSGDA